MPDPDAQPTQQVPFRLIPSRRRARSSNLAIAATGLALGVTLLLWRYPHLPWPIGLGILAAVFAVNSAWTAWNAARHGARTIEVGPADLVIHRTDGTRSIVHWAAVERVDRCLTGIVLQMWDGRRVALNTDGLATAERRRLEAATAHAVRQATLSASPAAPTPPPAP